MLDARKLVESDLADTLEGEFGVEVSLTDPDGEISTARGQWLFDIVQINPESGEAMIVDNPVIVLRRSSLNRVPIAGETWHVRAPADIHDQTIKTDYVSSYVKSPAGGASIGYVKLYLQRADQS
jgi:hypothetical protein